MPAPRHRIFLAAQIVFATLVLGYLCRSLAAQWRSFRGLPVTLHPRWALVLLSGAIYLLAYVVLIETWRAMLGAWHAELRFWDAARIWCVSNLTRYVPGKIWQIGLMGAMARQRQVSASAAAGSAVLNTVINIAVGMAIALVTGWSVLPVLSRGHAMLAMGLVAGTTVALVLLPVGFPRLMSGLQRLTGRELPASAFPSRAIGYAIGGNVVAWMLYGVALRMLVAGVLGSVAGTVAQYTALYSSSYVLGYLVLVLPAGVGVRDGALAFAMGAMGLATPQQALVVAVVSRLWLTVLEVTPGLLFLAWMGARRRHQTSNLANPPT